MAKIREITATEMLDGRGLPTVEVTVVLSDNTTASASYPSGISSGNFEAAAVYDKDQKRYNGLGVLQAVNAVNTTITPALVGKEATHQADIDKIMIQLDGTQNKSRLGANAILPVSVAVAKAAAKSAVLPLFLYLRQFINTDQLTLRIPTPLFSMISGGKHGNHNVNFEEFLIIPATSTSFEQALQMGVTIQHAVKEELKLNRLPVSTTANGSVAPDFNSNSEAIELINKAVANTNYRLGFDIFYGIDAAADDFFVNKQYNMKDRAMGYSSNDLIAYYELLNKTYHLLYLEDPLADEDWEGWQKICEKLNTQTLIVGDDLISANPFRLQLALDKKAATGIAVNPTKIGTIIETLAIIEVARQAGLRIIITHRGAETNDTFIADMAVAVSADYMKLGGIQRGEHIAKYNRLLAIDKQIHTLSAPKGQ